MYFIHEKKGQPGRWEVAWMWLPHFLTADLELHRHVDREMTEAFRGSKLEGDVHNMYPPTMTPLLEKMHSRVVDLILEKYPIHGLRHLLEAYSHIQPDEEVAQCG